jgi:hypothetical protein
MAHRAALRRRHTPQEDHSPMLHPQDSRRARRAARTRRTHTTGAVVAISLLALAGLSATAPAFAAQTSATSGTAAVAVTGSDAETLREISDDAQSTLDSAREALTVARNVSTDIAASGLDVGVEDTTIDTTALRAEIDRLSELDVMPALLLSGITDDTVTETRQVLAHAGVLRGRLEAEAAAAASAALAAANTPEGAQATARQMASANYGWGDGEFSCLVSLWNKESGWNYQAHNSSSGAHGIPQALPGSKMASAGADWQTNAATQVAWGLGYISGRYGNPCGAWSHSQSTGWY